MTAGFLVPASDSTLVEQIVSHFATRIDQATLRAGSRMPSIRQLAGELRVSKFTVVEAYERLIASGRIESRRGSGFFVSERTAPAAPVQGTGLAAAPGNWADAPSPSIDLAWLLRNMFKRLPPDNMPGSGVLPGDYLDAGLLESSVRQLGRQNLKTLLDYGEPQGYLPLRQQLQLKLAEIEIRAPVNQLMTTHGVTQALDLLAQHLLSPGDTVLVDEPSWFLMFGRFSQLGVRVVGVPRTPEGPDLQQLRALCERYRPRMFVVVSVLHNPTSTSMTGAHAFQLLRMADEFDFTVVEDDVYGDLHPGPTMQPCIRLAALDQLRRVVYLGGFSKTLAANLRVGFVAASEAMIRELTDLKMLVGLTSPELGERIVYRVLSEGLYRRHLERMRGRLNGARDAVLRRLEQHGLTVFAHPCAGKYLWADAGVDTAPLARRMLEEGFLLAPGSLFLPDQRASSWLRFNVATSLNPAMWSCLARLLDARPRPGDAKTPAGDGRADAIHSRTGSGVQGA